MNRVWVWLGLALLLTSACGGDDDAMVQTPEPDAGDDAGLGLPTSAAEVEALIASGDYLNWVCEPAPRAMRGPSSHGVVRICANLVLSTYVSDADDWLRGSASMKELYASESDAEPYGYSYDVKVDDDSADGAGWYWYERRNAEVTADGRGGASDGSAGCVACHAAAGSDATHMTIPGSRDFVYTGVTR